MSSLRIPANVHLLVWGPSWVREISLAILCANTVHIVRAYDLCTLEPCTGPNASCTNLRDYTLKFELRNGASITSIANHMPLMVPQMRRHLRRFVKREGFTHILFMMAHASDFYARKALANPHELRCLNHTRAVYGPRASSSAAAASTIAATPDDERLYFEAGTTSSASPMDRVRKVTSLQNVTAPCTSAAASREHNASVDAASRRADSSAHVVNGSCTRSVVVDHFAWPSSWDYGGDGEYCSDPGRWMAGQQYRNVSNYTLARMPALQSQCDLSQHFPRPEFTSFAPRVRVLELLPWFQPGHHWWGPGRAAAEAVHTLPTHSMLFANGWKCEVKRCTNASKWPAHECLAGSPVYVAQRAHRMLFG